MKDKFFLAVGLLIILGSFYLFWNRPANSHYQNPANSLQLTADSFIRIGEQTIQIEIADTDAERNLGLSGRPSLPEGRGLFFIFDIPGKYGFWMKDMNFPIDIVWIDESWHVVAVERDVPPDSYPKIFYPVRAIKYVLELPAGTAALKRIDVGAPVYLSE